MNRIFYITIALFFIAFTSCKEDKNADDIPEKGVVKEVPEEIPVPDGQQLYRGDFIYSVDAGVLTANNTFYAVETDSMMFELNRVAKALKKDQYDAVNVVIHGVEKPNPLRQETGEGWEKMVTIKKIIEVTPANNAQVIRTGGTSNPQNASK